MEDEMGMTCSMRGKVNKFIQNISQKTYREGATWETQDIKIYIKKYRVWRCELHSYRDKSRALVNMVMNLQDP